MKQFYKYILTLVAILMVTTPAWADCTIFSDGGEYEVMKYKFPSYQAVEKAFTISNPQPSGILTFTYWEQTAAIGGVDVTATYSDGTSEKILSSSKGSNPSYNFNGKIVTKLTFKGTSGTLKKTISNVKLTRHTSISASPATLSFPLTAVGATSAAQTVTITYSNIGNNYSITSTNTNDFSISPLPFTYDKCGGEMLFAITFHPQGTTGGARSGSFTIAGDGNGKSNNFTSITISVNGTAKGFPEFTWKGNTQYYVDESLDLSNLWTTTSNETTPKYSIKRFTSTDTFGSADPHFTDATNTKILLSKEGELVLQMHQDASTTYSPLTKEVTIKIVKHNTNFALNFANEYFVDDEINKSTFFTNATNSEVAIQVSDKTADNRALFTYNGSILKANGATLNANSETTTITVTQPENYKWTSYSHDKIVTVKKYPTDFNWLLQDTYFVGETITSIFNKSANGLPSTITSSDPTIVKVENNQLIALRAGKVRITVSQAVDRKWVAFTHEKEITIIKRNTNFQLLLGTTYYVDDRIAKSNIYSKANENPLPVSIVSSNPNILEYDATTQQLIARNAGKATITVSQAKDTTWTDFNQSLEVTILKHNIVATINPDKAVWNDLVTNPFAATSTHPVSGQVTPIDNDNFNVEQRSNEHIALMDANTRNIQTYYTNGQVNFLITRPEDYKYNALNQTLTLHVNQSGETCNLITDETANANHSTGQNSNGTYSKIFTLNGIGDKLIFKYYLNGRADYNHYVTPQYSTTDTGDNFNDITTRFTTQSTTPTSSDSITLPVGTKRIRFKRTAATLGTKHVLLSNITVTRAKSLTPSESPVILPVTSIGTPETKTFTLNWSTCEDEILLTNSNPHFSINTHNISSTAGQGSTAITVTCDASVVGTLRDTIVIYDQTQRIFVPVECEVNDKFIANIKGTTAYSKKVDDTWVADFKFDTCQTTLPSDDINAPFYYTIEHDLTGNDVRKPGCKDQVITYVPTYNPDTKEVVNTITAHNAGTAVLTFIQRPTESHYTDTLRCVITVTKYTTSFDLKGRTTYYTGDEDPYNALFNTLTNNSDVTMTFTSGDESVIKYEDSKLKALCAGSTSFTVAQAESYKWFGLSQTLNINVKKYNSNFSLTNNGADITCLIGDKIDALSLYTTANNEILPTITSDNPAVVSFNPTTRQLEANTAGEAIITIAQPVDCKWTEYTATRKIIVHKHTPVFTFQKPVYFNDTVVDYFTTSNTQTPLSITSQTDTDVAIVYFDQNNPNDLYTTDLISFIKEDTTFVTFTQEENWYWYARTVIDTIVPINPSNHVTFTLTENNRTAFDKGSYILRGWENQSIQFGDDGGGLNYDDKYLIIEFTGIPDSLSFTTTTDWAATTEIGNNIFFYTQEGKTKDNLSQIWSSTNKENNVKIKLNPDTRWLKICYSGNLKGFFHNVTVTELNEFRAVDSQQKTLDKDTLDFGANQVYTNKTRTFDLRYANPGYKISVESTDPHFTVDPSYIGDIGGEYHGTRNIDVTYTSTEPYATSDDAMIILTDEIGNRDSVFLSASSYKAEQVIHWRNDFEAIPQPIIRLKNGEITDAAWATSTLPVTFASNNEAVIKISDDGKTLIPVAEGEAEITAYQLGNETWLPADPITKTFIVTEKLLQYIIWDDDLTNIIKEDITPQTLTLTTQVYLQQEDGTVVFSQEQTNKLTYQSGNSNIVSVSGNTLTIHNVGNTTLTATVNGNDDYATASMTKTVIVRSATPGCDDNLLYHHEGDPIQFFQYNLNEIAKDPIALDRSKGEAGYVVVSHYGQSWNLAIQYYAAEIRVEQSLDNCSTWNTIETIQPVKNQENVSTIPLNRQATHIRFVRNYGGQGYQFLYNIDVHPAQYIEAQDVVDFGEIHVGSRETRTFPLHYSNIKHSLSPVPSTSEVTATPNTFGECSGFGTQDISVTWLPTQVDDNATATITFTDPNSGMTKVVTLRAKVTTGTQNIDWDNIPDIIQNCNNIQFPERTTANLPITWTVIEGEEYANFNEDGILEIYKNGTIIVEATQDGTANYEPLTPVQYTFYIQVQTIFVGTEDSDWHNPNNWTMCRLPYPTEVVTMEHPATLSTHATIAGVIFSTNGSIHITHTGGLTINEAGVTNAATDGNSITIDNNPQGAGFLLISPSAPEANKYPYFTMNFTTRAFNEGVPRDETWQYMGAPGNNATFKNLDSQTLIYHWDETKGWTPYSVNGSLPTWNGYALTQSIQANQTYQITAQAMQGSQTINLTRTEEGMKGDNLFVNSFTAPIDITKIDPTTDVTGDWDYQTFYLFNTGSWNDWQGVNPDHKHDASSPGHYYTIPILSAQYLDDAQTVIPPMQGVYVHTEAPATITLDYSKHVWNGTPNNTPMRAPQKQDPNFRRIRIQASSQNSGADRMYIIQESSTTRGYDNGYDGKNINASGQVNIYTNEPFGKMEVSCANDIDSMYIGFRAGNDTHYTLTFGAIAGDSLYLQDLENDSIIPLFNDEQYHFTAQPNTVNNSRFLLLSHPRFAPNTSTPTTDINGDTLAKIWSIGSTIYIANAPANSWATLYTVSGHLVLSTPIANTQSPATLDVSHLPQGVYILRLNNQVYKFVCK